MSLTSAARIKVLHLAAADSMLFPNLRDQLLYLRAAGFDVHTASIAGSLAPRLPGELGIPWTPLPLSRRKLAFWSDWNAVRFVERFCRQERFDIVHTHTPKGSVAGQWGARRAGVPIVLQTLHGFYFHDLMPAWERRLWIGVERFSARHSDHILCQNPEDAAAAVRERIAGPERITLLGNGTDLEQFSPADEARRARVRRALSIPLNARVAGMAGRFVTEKGFPEFLAACERLMTRIPELHVLAVGHRLESERPGEAWSPETGRIPRERITVLTGRDDMPDIYAAMDLHVLPSHREGFPRALVEGAAMGLAQVATNVRGCRQAVADGETGVLVPVADAPALAEAIAGLLGNDALRAQYGRAAREKALREFDQRTVFNTVVECYRRLLAAKHLDK